MMPASSTTTAEAYRKRNILRLVLAATAALCLPAYFNTNFLRDDANVHRVLYEGEVEEYDDLAIPEWLLHPETLGGHTYSKGPKAIMSEALAEAPAPRPHTKTLIPYSIDDVMKASELFSNTYAMLVYDPPRDDFLFVYLEPQWTSGCTKLKSSFRNFALLLRKTFPERFQGPGSPELAIGISSGDYPHLRTSCLSNFPHVSEQCAEEKVPVLQFGSAFRSTEIFPNMIAMPMPEKYNLKCFKIWAEHDQEFVCRELRAAPEGDLVFGLEAGLKWIDLIPQVVWRGTDYGYLNHIEKDQGMPYFVPHPAMEAESDEEKALHGLTTLREQYDQLYPRWKAAVLTAEAEQDLKKRRNINKKKARELADALPWANMKFSGSSVVGKVADWDELKEYGIPALGDRLSLDELAKYKYHIDLGGGGGTTWSGTIQKLAMPGLLFHHMTPTKDYIHDRMRPWVHYVPVAPDLSDLKEKFHWAEAHPHSAKLISQHGSALMRSLGTMEGFGKMFEEEFVEPIRRVMDMYQPVETVHPGMSWREVVTKVGVERAIKVHAMERCSGHGARENDCEKGDFLLED